MSDETPSNSLDFLKDLSFAPTWAKEPPKEQTLDQFSDGASHDFRGPRRPFGDRSPRRDGDRPPRRDGEFRGERREDDRPPRRDGGFRGERRDGDRPPRRDGEFRGERRDGDRPPRRDDEFRGERREDDRPPRREDGERRPFHGDRGPRRDGGERRPFRGDRPPRIDVSTLPVEVKYLPDQKSIGVVIRKVQGGHRAYPIRDLARLFLDNPASCDVRIEVKPEEKDLFLHQCTRCGFVTTDPEALRAHMFEKHFDEEFEKSTVEGEAPSGVFSCVAKCGISGRLIGPPNHHSFAQHLRDTQHEVAPGMSEEEYRRRLEMVHDEAVIQQWKDESRVQTVYRRKAEAVAPADADATAVTKESQVQSPESQVPSPESQVPSPESQVPSPESQVPSPESQVQSPVEMSPVEAAPTEQGTGELANQQTGEQENPSKAEESVLDRAMAEAVFMHDVVPKCTTSRKRVSCSFEQAQEIRDPKIAPVVREAWRQEQRSPLSLFIALRGAFRAKKFHVFRAVDGRGAEFVIPKVPTALDVTHAVPELVKVIEYVRDHRGCTRSELFAALDVPLEGTRTADQDRIYQQFAWIIESAHLIEYHNGVLALPEEHPYFRQLPRPRPQAADEATAEVQGSAFKIQSSQPESPQAADAAESQVPSPESQAEEPENRETGELENSPSGEPDNAPSGVAPAPAPEAS